MEATQRKDRVKAKEFFAFLSEFLREVIVGVFLAAAISYDLFKDDLVRGIIFGTIVFTITFVLTILLQLLSRIGLLRVLWNARGIGGIARKPLSRLIESDTKRLIDTLDELNSDNGVEFDKERANDFYNYCFQGANKYSGTDTNVPSQFFTKPDTSAYFQRHKDLQTKHKQDVEFPPANRNRRKE